MYPRSKAVGGFVSIFFLGLVSLQVNAQAVVDPVDSIQSEAPVVASQTDVPSDVSDVVDTVPAEAMVYLIREKKFVGGGRDIWIALNDRVIGALSNGSHLAIPVKAGLNSVNLVQAKAGWAYATVDNRAGGPVYLKVDYLAGVTTELSAEEGQAWLQQTKPVAALDEARPNDAYDNLLINPDLLRLGLMTEGVERLSPDAESAVITFYRPGKLIAAVPFGIWSAEGFVGSLLGSQSFQVRVAPGNQTFVGFSERLSVLKATVEAGKEYAVELDVGMGWNQAHIKLLPLNLGMESAKVAEWKRTLTLVGTNPAVLETSVVAPRITAGYEYLQSIKAQWAAEDAASRTLEAGFGG